jgi:cytochrome c biogenesis protein
MGEEARKDGGASRELVGWLGSLRLTVYLLILLGLAVLAGTVIPQVDVTLPREVLFEKMNDPVWRVMHLLGLTDVFRSVWFIFLLVTLMANLTVCSLRFVQRTRRMLAGTSEVLDEAAEQAAGMVRRVDGAKADVAALQAKLRRIGEVKRSERDGAVYLFAQTPPLLRYNPVVVHLSLLFVIAGALLRVFLGIEGQIALPEGASLNVFVSKSDQLMRLPYDIRCDKFAVEFYDGGRRPKDYRSTLTVWQDGRKIDEKTIKVNNPLTAGAFRFFQASYGQGTFPVLHLTGGGLDTQMPVLLDQIHSIPNRRDALIADETRAGENGDEVHLRLTAGGERFEAWLARGVAQTIGPYSVTYVGPKQGFYTGLLVTADPGAPLLWAGFAIFFIGLFLTLFAAHKRAWARIEGSRVVLAASASRNREAMERWLDETAAGVKKG